MVPLPCLGTRHPEDNVAIADGRGSQWQQKEAAEGEEVIGDFLPSSLEAAFGDTLSERAWASSADSVEQEQLEWSLRTIRTGPPSPFSPVTLSQFILNSLQSWVVLSSSIVPYLKGSKLENPCLPLRLRDLKNLASSSTVLTLRFVKGCFYHLTNIFS